MRLKAGEEQCFVNMSIKCQSLTYSYEKVTVTILLKLKFMHTIKLTSSNMIVNDETSISSRKHLIQKVGI